jgi:protoheme IX farnesyltransferase
MPLAAMVTLTTATGNILYTGRFSADIWLPMLGVFLLACGSIALNQCQESRFDARMERTRYRPIPSGRLDRTAALLLGVTSVLAGLTCCLAAGTRQPELLVAMGAFAVAWYNGVYTMLKRVTAFAAVPGAILGAVGPLLGWVAAGGGLTDRFILLVAGFFFVWQIPHFWLLVLLYGDQHRAANVPSASQLFLPGQSARIAFMWITAASALGILMPTLAGGRIAGPAGVALIVSSLWMAVTVAASLGRLAWVTGHNVQESQGENSARTYRGAFIRLNVFGLLVMAALTSIRAA